MTDLDFQRLYSIVIEMQGTLNKLVEHNLQSSTSYDTATALSFRGLPPIPEMSNLEITFFDNGRGSPGKSRLTVKAEYATEKADFKNRRCEYSDLHDLSLFETKLRKRAISAEYRDELKDLIDASINRRAETLIGMFCVKGAGAKGVHWLEHQYMVINHDGEYKPLVGVLKINSEMQHLDFRAGYKKHPITGKPYDNGSAKSENIKAKAICMPKKEIADRELARENEVLS